MTFGRMIRHHDRKFTKVFDKTMTGFNPSEVDHAYIHQRGYNLADLNKDIASVQNDKTLKLSGGYNLNMTLQTGFGCFTPPSESQAITTLKKRTAIVQHYKKARNG